MWTFFQRKVCLTLGPEWDIATQEFARVGLSDVQRFDALPIDDKGILGPHQSFNASSRQMLTEFYESDDETCLILEDDCVFLDLTYLPTSLCELPDDWDVVYLGANLLNGQPQKYSEHLHRVTTAWTTHAIGYNRKAIPFLLKGQPGFSVKQYDDYLGSVLPELSAFVVNPMVAWQRPRYSSIWLKDTDYSDIFAESQRRLV